MCFSRLDNHKNKMVSPGKYTLTIVIIGSIACSAFAFQCYHCDSTIDAKCGDKFESDERFKVDCDRLMQQQPQPIQFFGPFITVNATGCVKRLYDHRPGQPRIQRTCFYGDAKHGMVDCRTDPNQPNQRALNCDVCKQDYCNGSKMLQATGLGLLLVLFVGRSFF